jgi:4-amino-4-deoxy-L-arabinose transferase-like glycosyltransferase
MKGLKEKLKKYFKLILFLIFILALVVRWWHLPANAISFAYDQARDAFVVGEILSGDLKILGPSVSGIPGLYHGVLYYYVIAPAYLLGHGSPVTIAYWLSFLNALVVFVIYFLAKKMTGKTFPALIASLIFAVSFEATQYATWLSNPAMGVWFVPLIYLALYLWLKEKKNGYLALLGLAYGLSIQSDISLAYHIVPIGLWLWYGRKNIGKRQILTVAVAFLIAISSMLLVEFRFGFKSLEGIKHLLTSQQIHDPKVRLGDYFVAYANHMGKIFAHNLFPFISAFGGLLGMGILARYIFNLKNVYKDSLEIKVLITWILSYLVAASVAGSNIPHIGVGLGVGFIILTALFIWEIHKKNKFIALGILSLILIANAAKIISENVKGQTIFAIQVDMTLANELKVIDYTYQHAGGKPFSINSLTSPLFINTTWSYLYNWYGVKTYGYLPSWSGKSQVGSLGDNLPKADGKEDKHFYIVEDMEGIPPIYLTYGLGEEDAHFTLIGETTFGKLKVQERRLKNAD